MTELSTPWSRGLGLSTPIVNAPMGGVAGARLAAAVTAAGGLGMVGMGSTGSVESLRDHLDELGDTAPFGIGIVEWVRRRSPELLEVALAARPTLFSVSFGDDYTWVEKAHAAGVLTTTQVYSTAEAVCARDAGVDVIVARGSEGGGHGDPSQALLPLLASVLDAVDVPVLAAGGIASPRSLAAVLAAGASGAWIGTALSATPESSAPEEAKTLLLQSDGTETVLTRAYDVVQQWPWPSRFPSRVLRNPFTDRWTAGVEALQFDEVTRTEAEALTAAWPAVDAGVGVGQVTAPDPVAAVIERLTVGARDLLAPSHTENPGT